MSSSSVGRWDVVLLLGAFSYAEKCDSKELKGKSIEIVADGCSFEVSYPSDHF